MSVALKRVIGFFMVVMAALSLVVTIFMLVQLWRVQRPLIENLSATISLLDDTLKTSSDGLAIARQSLDQAETSLANLQATVATLAKSLNDSQPLIGSMTTLIGQDLPDTVVKVQTSLVSAQASAKVIDAVLRALTIFNPSAYNPPQPLDKALGETAASLQELPASFVSMQASLKTTGGNLRTIQGQVAEIAQDIGEISASIQSARQVLAQYQVLVDDLQARLESLRPGLPTWVNTLTWALTFVLVWLGVAQAGILLKGWEVLFARL